MIGLKCYYRVQVMGNHVDIVPYKYQTKSKLSHKYFKKHKTLRNRFIEYIGFKFEFLYRFPKTNIGQHYVAVQQT